MIDLILKNIGVYPHRYGYFFIKDMVLFADGSTKIKMKPLYEKTALKHNTSVYSVQNGIRKACETSFNTKKHLYLNEIIRANAVDENRQPTNSELISLIVSYINENSGDEGQA